MQTQTTCFSTMTGGRVDRDNGVIHGVSVITQGEAKGHGIKIDRKTLETLLSVASEFTDGVKVKMRHRQDKEHQNVISDTAGLLKQFSISGQKVIANLHILKSLSAETKEKIFEMAEVMPEEFGLSIDFSGLNEEINGEKFARCTDLRSVDLSDNPAANPDGLFSMSDKHKDDCDCAECKKLSDAKKPKTMSVPTNEELATSLSKLAEMVTGLVTKFETKQPVTMLSYKGEDGKDIQLSASDIALTLSESKKMAEEAKKKSDLTARLGIIEKMGSEGRVPMNPKSRVAYTLEELNALPLETLQFAALNSPVVPMQAKAIYRGKDNSKAPDPKLKGSELVTAVWDEKYTNLDAMLATPFGQTVTA